ncbi:N-(5'-phosphoribosyl)anthranilate isomerase [Yarrowia sp. C11]|nr:N-(5'-phosphoribosyl)anthranilate isomerase [Yarrowia sp. E02]KAG5373023.1 N-(5'-phosphoribosyl)anthranilate isomerase [Yarrowia sp. C11]
MNYLYSSTCLHPVGEFKGQLNGLMVPKYTDSDAEAWYRWIMANRHAQALIYTDSSIGVEQGRLVRDLYRQFDPRPMIIRRLDQDAIEVSQIQKSRVMGCDGLVFPHSANISDLADEVRDSGLHILRDGFSYEGEKVSVTLTDGAGTCGSSKTSPTPECPHPTTCPAHNSPTAALGHTTIPTPANEGPVVKICGLRTLEAAVVAMENGADMLGMILVPGRARTVNFDVAREIAAVVRSGKYRNVHSGKRPLLVGVFRNQPLPYILSCVADLNLDIVQLHGDEPLDWCRQIPVSVIKRVSPGKRDFRQSLVAGYQAYSLLDSEVGGEGQLVDWTSAEKWYDNHVRFILAGGLTPENVAEAVQVKGVIGVDVSGGVETDGEKDLDKIRLFIKNARK